LLAFTAAPASLSAAVEAKLKPVAVTVYPDSALVERSGEAKCGRGQVTVAVPGVPADVDDLSVRCDVAGPAGTRFYGVRVSRIFSPEVTEPRARGLLDQIQVLMERKEDLADRITARKAEMEILTSLGKESAKGGANVGNIAESTKGVGTRLAVLMSESRKDDREMRELDKKITTLRAELGQTGQITRESKTVEADLELPSDGTVKIGLAYLVRRCGWTPVYDLRLDTGGKKPKLNLSFAANIRQGTGEDWDGVNLVVSTARPSEGGQVPDPTNWWLDFQPPPRPYYGRAAKLASAPSAKREEAGFASEDKAVPVEMEEAATVRSEFATTYAIARPAVIPSDGNAHRVGITESTHDVEVTLVAVPRLVQAAFIEAEVAYDGEQQLLPGPAGLFRDGQFAGTVPLGSVAPGEKFRISLGRDANVKVERKLINQKAAGGGFLGWTKAQRRYNWVTTVSNYHPGVRTVEVREQLPRSRQKDIVVEPLDLSPEPLTERQDQPGLKRWRLDIAPKGTAKVTFSYLVKFPEGSRIYGLD